MCFQRPLEKVFKNYDHTGNLGTPKYEETLAAKTTQTLNPGFATCHVTYFTGLLGGVSALWVVAVAAAAAYLLLCPSNVRFPWGAPLPGDKPVNRKTGPNNRGWCFHQQLSMSVPTPRDFYSESVTSKWAAACMPIGIKYLGQSGLSLYKDQVFHMVRLLVWGLSWGPLTRNRVPPFLVLKTWGTGEVLPL